MIEIELHKFPYPLVESWIQKSLLSFSFGRRNLRSTFIYLDWYRWETSFDWHFSKNSCFLYDMMLFFSITLWSSYFGLSFNWVFRSRCSFLNFKEINSWLALADSLRAFNNWVSLIWSKRLSVKLWSDIDLFLIDRTVRNKFLTECLGWLGAHCLSEKII